ncbi:MAG: hypothetical protein H6590_10195 [Flavobacteriales bacterium]|nr:hypothetical protein [Flavobacteriales bacterium]
MPACLAGLRDTHDWGDDFAQYLAQARDLSSGQRIDPDKEVVNWVELGPAPKGTAFSLMLAPIWKHFGRAVVPYLLFISLVMLAWCVLTFWYLRPDLGSGPAFVAALLLAYDRHVLALKSEVMPDMLLGVIVVATLLIARSSSARRWWWCAGMVGLAVLVKSAAWVLYLALLVQALRMMYAPEGGARPSIPQVSALVAVPVILSFGIPHLLSLRVASGAVWYADVFIDHGLVHTGARNILSYGSTLYHWSEQELPWWIVRGMLPVIALLAGIGVVVRMRRGGDAGDLFLLGWMTMLLYYPYTNAEVRFLVPAMPFLLRYPLTGAIWCVRRVSLPEQPATTIMLGGYLLAQALTIKLAFAASERPVAGPWSKEALDAFDAVVIRTAPTDVVGTSKPWAVHLFTGRTTAWSRSGVGEGPADALLLSTDPQDVGMFDGPLLVGTRKDAQWRRTWSNDSFALFQPTGIGR